MKRTTIMTLVLLFAFTAAQAQIKIDVKTELANKNYFAVQKNAFIHVLDKSKYFQVVETGEDYSVWLTSVSTGNQYDARQLYATVHIRTPAMFTNGDFIKELNSFDAYQNKDFEGINGTGAIASKLATMETGRNLYVNLVGRSADFTGNVTNSSTAGVIDVSNYLDGLMQEVNTITANNEYYNPSDRELAEALMLGTQMVMDLKNYFY